MGTDLKDSQKSSFQIEAKTGMVISAKPTANVEGTLRLLGKDIPVTIDTLIAMERE